MNRAGHENVEFFLGPEVEHTPAHGKRTLFVVGYQEPDAVVKQARDNKVTHVYLGANHSFDPATVAKGNAGQAWGQLITELLSRGFFVTIDYEAHHHATVLLMFGSTIWNSRQFIPMLSVRIPRIETTSPNLTIKIDDVDFQATNEGVWCMNYREVTDSNRFTPWSDYTQDTILSAIETVNAREAIAPAPAPVAPPVQAPAFALVKEMSPVINDSDAGLDTTPTTALKPETQENAPAKVAVVNTSPADAAAAYAEAATETKKAKK